MKRDKTLWRVCLAIYRELYRKASPPADFDKLLKSGVTNRPYWFLKYSLGMKDQYRIIDKHCRRNRLTEEEACRVRTEVGVGCAPAFEKRRK